MDLIEELLVLAGVPLDETERLDEMKEKDAGEEIRVGEFPTLKNAFSDLILKLPENQDDIGNHIKTNAKILVEINGVQELQTVCVLTGKYDGVSEDGTAELGYSVRHILGHLYGNISEKDKNIRTDIPTKTNIHLMKDALRVLEKILARRAQNNKPVIIDCNNSNTTRAIYFNVANVKFCACIGLAQTSDEIAFLLTLYPVSR